MDVSEGLRLTFQGVFVFPASDPGEAAHFFEHVLGLPATAEDGPLRFYTLASDLTVALDASGASGDDPYLLFSANDITLAAEHFLQQGCKVGELPWARGAGFLARSPEGRTVCVVAEEASDQE